MTNYDALVVGAGPAGSVAAYHLAKMGFSTLLLEKFSLPRDKPCGGAVMYRGIRVLEGQIPKRLVERSVYGLRFVLPDDEEVTFLSQRLLGITTTRSAFDEFLARRASDAGAVLLEQACVKEARISSIARVQLRDGREFTGRVIVGADGVNSVIARTLGLRAARKNLMQVGLGMEADFHVGEDRVREVFEGNPTILEMFPVENRVSYGWVFPKREHLSIGIAGVAVHMYPLRPVFDRFIKKIEQRVGISLTASRRGTCFIGAGGLAGPNVTDRAVLVGDAAGFVDPMMGEGIAYAMRSGVHAATILGLGLELDRLDKKFLSRYHHLCVKEFGSNFAIASWAGLRGISFARSVLTAAARLDFTPDIIARLARGEMGYSDIPSEILRRAPWVFSQLLRAKIMGKVS